jgi:hypothetical protein
LSVGHTKKRLTSMKACQPPTMNNTQHQKLGQQSD